jgi:hypothetical protein
MPTARTTGATAVVNNILYAIGGSASNILSTVEAYDPSTDTWSTKASMPTGLNSTYAVVENGIIFVIGGCTGITGGVRLTTVHGVQPSHGQLERCQPRLASVSQAPPSDSSGRSSSLPAVL